MDVPMTSAVRPHACPHAARLQRGSALFLALMLLIVLSLLGISVATVTALQERMAGAYHAEHLAFERTEARLRSTERSIATALDPCHAATPDPAADWSTQPPPAAGESYRNMGRGDAARGFGWRGSLEAGQPAMVGDIRCAYFEVSAVDFDTADVPGSSRAVVTSVYVP